MGVVYLQDHAATVQANQWVEYRQKLNPFFVVTFGLMNALYAIALLEFGALTYFIGFMVFIKVFCHFRIKEYKKAIKHGGGVS